jgi:hypothetical protein
VPAPRAARRFIEIVCPPEVRVGGRADRVLDEFGLMLGALPDAARKAMAVALALLDHCARLYPAGRGRRFARLDDRVADAYVRALLARHDPAAELIRRLKSVLTMCYYELPEVHREIGYDPAPYIAAVSRRRRETYGPQIHAAESANQEQIRPDQSNSKDGQDATGVSHEDGRPDAG